MLKPTTDRAPHAPVTGDGGHLMMRIEGEDGPKRIGLSEPPKAISDNPRGGMTRLWSLVPQWVRDSLKR